MSLTSAFENQKASPLDIESQILGDLEVKAEECFEFPQGIFGFPACKQFVLIPAERPDFFWLQSVDCGSLTFLLVDPFVCLDEFFLDLTEGDMAPLQAKEASDIGVLAIVTMPKAANEPPTANLQGLLALNFKNNLGRQVIVRDSPHGTKWPLDLRRLREAS